MGELVKAPGITVVCATSELSGKPERPIPVTG